MAKETVDAGYKLQFIVEIDRLQDHFNFMIPIRPAANYIQNQINFGKRFNLHFTIFFSLAITDKNPSCFWTLRLNFDDPYV